MWSGDEEELAGGKPTDGDNIICCMTINDVEQYINEVSQ